MIRFSPTGDRRSLTLTPLIDVVFILLVFFMLETSFLNEGGLAASMSRTGGMDESTTAIIEVRVFDQRFVWINENRIARVDTQQLQDGVEDLVAGGLSTARLSSGPAVTVDELVRLGELIQAAGVASLILDPAPVAADR